MTHRSIPRLLADLIRYAGRVTATYARCCTTDSHAGKIIAQDAIMWNLYVLGKIKDRLGPTFHDQHPEILWPSIIGQHNVFIHGYDVFVWDQLIPLIESDLPILIQQIELLARQFGPPPQDYT